METIITTDRLLLRQMNQNDFADLCEMLQDRDVMYAWEHTFSVPQVQEWLDRQLERYENTDIGYWAATDKKTGDMIGQIGLVWADINGENVLELAYMLKKTFWNKGFAVEGGRACLDYAFKIMGVGKVYAPIRPENKMSRNVVEKLGFEVRGEHIIHYNGKDMLHLVYVKDAS